MKRFSIYKIFFFVLFLFVLFFIVFCNFKLKKSYNLKGDLKVNATPISNKIIVLDAGHGLPDAGASSFDGTTEQAINLEIVLKLQKILEQSGADVILTRSDENGIYSMDSKSIRNKKVSDTKNRVELANNSNADVFLSIHLNKFSGSSKYRGWQTFYQKDSEKSKLIANNIQDNLNKNIDLANDRNVLPISDVYIMEHVKIPSVIVECGFLSNPDETNNLKKEEYQNSIAWGIYLGLQDFFFNEEKFNE